MMRTWQGVRSLTVWSGAAVLALAACSSTAGTGGTGSGSGGTGGGGSGSGGKIPCVNAASTGSVDCAAKIAVEKDDGAQVSNNGAVKFKPVDGGKATLTVKNPAGKISAAPLVITRVEFLYEPLSPDEDPEAGNTGLSCYADDGNGEPNLDAPCGALDGQWAQVVPVGTENGLQTVASLPIHVVYRKFDDKSRTAKVKLLVQNAPDLAKGEFTVTLVAEPGKPAIEVSKPELKWAFLKPGETDPAKTDLSLVMTNNGDAPLLIHEILSIGDAFSFKVDGYEGVFGKDPKKTGEATSFQPEEKLNIGVGESRSLTVTFTAKDDKPKKGELHIKSNDAAKPDATVFLTGNSDVPCLTLVPGTKLQYGGVLVGSSDVKSIVLHNCGTVDVEIAGVTWLTETAKDCNAEDMYEFNFAESWKIAKAFEEKAFKDKAVSYQGNQKADAAKVPSPKMPLFIPPGQDVPVTIKYTPATVNKGTIDMCTVQVASNTANKKTTLVEGVGVDQLCPKADFTVKEGEEVVPQTNLHLNSSATIAPGAPKIVEYKWSVKQPPGSNQPLLPNNKFPNPTLLANAAGEYTFCLEVVDANGTKSCQQTCRTVLVVPNNAVHIELLWDTPADPDQTDTGPMAGADLDLHFAHELAYGPDLDCDGAGDPWFSNPFDCFWYNANPNQWGSMSPAKKDDPRLDLDDTDGAGPENLNLEEPEGTAAAPTFYSIGVHYWNDHGFGTSYATVKIYMQGATVVAYPKTKMDPLDMWYVGKINWPNQLLGEAAAPVTTCYQTGDQCLFLTDPQNPKAGKMWKPATAPNADFCMTKCYINQSFVAAAGGTAQTAACKKKP